MWKVFLKNSSSTRTLPIPLPFLGSKKREGTKGWVSFLLLFFFCACEGPGQREVIIVSPHPLDVQREFSRGFAAWLVKNGLPETPLRWINVGGAGESVEYVKSRNAPGNPAGGLDIFFGGGEVPYMALQKLNLLAKPALEPGLLDRIPRSLHGVDIYGRDSLWFGTALSSFGVLCNRRVMETQGLPPPESWEDLSRPEYAGWLAAGDPRYSGTIHVIIEIMLQGYGWEHGWDLILRMAANTRGFAKMGSAAAREVALGQAALGLCVDLYAFAEIEEYGRDRLFFVLPDRMTVVTPDGIALLKNGREPEGAALFLQYVLTEGQKLWILKAGRTGGPIETPLCRLPVDSALYRLPDSLKSVTFNPFTFTPFQGYDNALSGKRWALVNDLFASFVLTPHRNLLTLRKKGGTPSGRILTDRLPMEAALSMCAGWSKPVNSRERIRLMNEWTRTALSAYAKTE